MHSFLIGKLECAKGHAMHRLAIYDLDKTLTRKATFPPFILHVLRHYRPLRAWALPLMALTTIGYSLRLITRARLKEMNLSLLLGKHTLSADADKMAASFAQVTMHGNILSAAVERVRADREAGYRIVIASASYHFYVNAIARQLGINDVIATDCVSEGGGRFLPYIAGDNCYGPAKLARVTGWLEEQGVDRAGTHVRFYSDHVSDAPCLAFADEAFATNPHLPLARLATEKRWPILNWLSES
jgi:HAD superfamily hydrolase (TIGR01490 family)